MHSFSERCSIGLAAFALLSGVLIFQQLSALPPPATAWLCLPALCLAWFYPVWRLPVFALGGFVWAWWVAAGMLAQSLPAQLEGVDVGVEGVIVSLPDRDAARSRFQFEVERLITPEGEAASPGRVMLSWYARPPPELRAGERWHFTVRLKRPHGMFNPGGFDYEAWLFRHRLRATGYVREAGDNRLLAADAWAQPVDRLRQSLSRTMGTALAGREYAGLVEALALGERGHISQDQWRVLTATGTNHLVAISGLHVGLVAGLVFFFARRAWLLWPRLALRWPAPKAGAVAGMAAALLYAAMAGFSVPTQRALSMVAVVMAGVLLQRRVRPAHGLAAALLLVLLWDPLAVMEAGFWLSFAAVAVIFYGMGGRLAPRGWWWRWGRVQLLVAVGLLPLMLILFQRVSLVAPLANIVAVPWVSLVVVPLTLLGTLLLEVWFDLGAWVLVLAEGALGVLWPLLTWLGQGPFAQWSQHVPPLWALAPAALGALMLMAPAGMPARWLGVVLLTPLFAAAPPRPAQGEVWLTLLDVGQGLSAVVRTARHSLVFDAGPAFSENFDAGEAVLVPYLRAEGVPRVDMLVVSHGDRDHLGGLASLLAQTPVRALLSSVPDKLSWRGGAAQACRAGQHWDWDGVRFDMLYPFPDSGSRGNDASCVLRVSTAGGALLLPGDIEKRSERALLARSAAALRADVLVAPHHGSNTSSTAAFLAAVRPRYALFPVGYRNRYGFPKPAVLARYATAGADSLASDRLGAISVRLGPGGLLGAPVSYRAGARRYWHASAEPLRFDGGDKSSMIARLAQMAP